MAPAQQWSGSGKVSKRKRRRIIRTVIAGCLVAAYATGIWYFSSHFTPGTTVDGVDASMMTTDELASAIQQRATDYQQHITNADGFDLTINASDIGLSSEGTEVASEALARTNPALWLPYLISPKHMLIDAHVEGNKEALTSLVEQAVASYNETAVPPTNSTGAYDEESGSFVVTQESTGTALDASKIVEKSDVAIHELRQDVQLGSEELLQPAINSKNETLVASVDEANRAISQDINLVIDGETISTIHKDTMVSWMSFDDKQKLVIDGVTNWIEANQKVNNAGNATDEEHVWALDTDTTVMAIHWALRHTPGSDVEIRREVIETKPVATPGAKERGRHLDVNLSTQFLRFYNSDGEVIWESYCVSGGWDPEFQQMHSTPTGTFAIQAKETGRTLVGADTNHDGKPDYESYVNYWMPFLNYDFGLHDATWRSEFGGDIRSWWGSHGCINLPYEKAESLYNIINVGDTVYIHD